MQENEFSQYVRILGRGRNAARSLTYDEALHAMTLALRGEVEDVQLGAFLMLLRIKEESIEELAGFAQAARNNIKRPQSAVANIDWPSYAGKRDGQALFILAMIVLAENGYSILCHGSRGHTENRLYTEDIFRELALPIADNLESLATLKTKHSLFYLPLKNFCEPLENFMHLRNLFGLRSPVHSFSKLINPGNCESMLVPTFHPSYKPVHQGAAKILKENNVSVFKGESGEAQRRPQAILSVDRLQNGQCFQEKWPAMLDTRTGDKTPAKLQTLLEIWRSKNNSDTHNAGIVGTIALAIHNYHSDKSIEQSLSEAQTLWHDRNRTLL